MTRLRMKKTHHCKRKKRAFFRSSSRESSSKAPRDRGPKMKQAKVLVSLRTVLGAVNKFMQGRGDR